MPALGFPGRPRQLGAVKRFILLLRAVNVGGRQLEMKALREAAQADGFSDCVTYIQSGNLIFSADGDEAAVEARIEKLIAAKFGLDAVAIARSADHFERIAGANPFPDAVDKMLHLCLSKRAVAAEAVALLTDRARAGERPAIAGGELWIDFVEGVGRSKITPSIIDKAAGSPVTARNWNTVRKLIELAKGG